MCRIGGRLCSCYASNDEVVVEIPPFVCLSSNLFDDGDSAWWVV
jgi:hypothetical protein